MEGKETKDMSPEEMMEAISGLVESVSGLTERMVKIEEVMSAKVEDAEEESETEDAEEESETEDAESSTMDSLKADNEALQRTVKDLTSTVDSLKKDGVKVVMGEISKRDALAVNLSQHIGTFDHAEMTLAEVAVYGADKLELKCEKGTELATLNGFLHNRQPMTTAHALDSKSATGTMDGLDDYLKGGK